MASQGSNKPTTQQSAQASGSLKPKNEEAKGSVWEKSGAASAEASGNPEPDPRNPASLGWATATSGNDIEMQSSGGGNTGDGQGGNSGGTKCRSCGLSEGCRCM